MRENTSSLSRRVCLHNTADMADTPSVSMFAVRSEQ